MKIKMKLFSLSLLLFVFIIFSNDANSQQGKTYDPVIQNIVDAVNGDTLWSDIAGLAVMQRFSTNVNAIQSSNFLKNYFTTLGFDTVYFQNYQSGFIPNVIAVKYGLTYPDSVIIAGAHYDVYASNAPGADDNASGTAGVMETGRVIMGHNYKRTIKIICFSGEEEGLYGSTAYANAAFTAGEKIKAAIIMDMIAYLKPGDPINSDVYFNTASTALKNNYASITSLYISNFAVAGATYPTSAGSDVAPFWNKGYKAIFPCEGQYSSISSNNHCTPYMHTSQDILGNSANSQLQAKQITQSVVATTITLAEIEQQALISGFPDKKYYFSINPVPASSNITVRYFTPETLNLSADRQDVKLSIYNIFGKYLKTLENSVKDKGAGEITFPINDIPCGIYFVKMEIGGYCFTKKIIVSR